MSCLFLPRALFRSPWPRSTWFRLQPALHSWPSAAFPRRSPRVDQATPIAVACLRIDSSQHPRACTLPSGALRDHFRASCSSSRHQTLPLYGNVFFFGGCQPDTRPKGATVQSVIPSRTVRSQLRPDNKRYLKFPSIRLTTLSVTDPAPYIRISPSFTCLHRCHRTRWKHHVQGHQLYLAGACEPVGFSVDAPIKHLRLRAQVSPWNQAIRCRENDRPRVPLNPHRKISKGCFLLVDV